MRIGYFAGNTGRVENSFKLSVSEIMNHTGHNTGNMAFLYGAIKLFNADTIEYFDWHVKVEQLQGKVDVLFFSVANFLNVTSDLKNLAKLVRELDIPCVVIGLGAQSEHSNSIPVLKQGTIDFLKEVSKRTPYICVRGEYTKKVCSHYGVDNVKVLGCPSILINENRNLGIIIESKMKDPVERVAVHASVIKAHMVPTEKELLRIVDFFDGTYVIQRPMELMKIISRENLTNNEIQYVQKINKLISPDLSYNDFVKMIRSKGVFFADLESWMHYLKSYSHAIGTRIHGTILPLSAGIPSICITHDTRTIELAERLLIPSIHYTKFMKYTLSTREIFENVSFSGKDFEDNRTDIANIYNNLFRELGITPSPKLIQF